MIMRYSLFALAFGIATICQAAPAVSTHVVHEQRHDSDKWRKLDRMPPDSLMPVRVGLSQSNLDSGYSLLMSVSDPSSSLYGKYYTQKQLTSLFSPSETTISSVHSWLRSQDIHRDRITHSDNRGWYAFDATVAEAEKLFHTEFHLFQHVDTGHMNVACDQYSVPKHLSDHIDYVTPGVRLFSPDKRTRLPGTPVEKRPSPPNTFAPRYGTGNATNGTNPLALCDSEISPACIRALYEVPLPETLYGGKPQPNNALGIFELGDVYLQENLNKFFRNFTPWIPQGTHPTPQFVDGAKAPGSRRLDTGESDLDFVLSYPLVYPQEIKLFQTDDSHYSNTGSYGDGLFNTFLDAIDGSYCTYASNGEKGNDPNIDPVYPDKHRGGYKGKLMCGVFKPTPVISISYGEQEADFPMYYQKRQCNEFLKLALQGVSVLVASGDSGVAGRAHAKNQCLGPRNTIFSPTYPANCPYLTTVGSTEVAKGRTVFEPEVAAHAASWHYHSGGGFSNIYPTPGYQSKAVDTYFSNHSGPPYPYYKTADNKNIGANGGLYNRGGRGIPDVSANGNRDISYTHGKWWLNGGTSAATPIFASIINRINEKRLAAGKSTLGFVNTALYANPSLLNDVTEGNNAGCGSKGFTAAKGWDPVTGLGTPSYKRMLAYFMKLP